MLLNEVILLDSVPCRVIDIWERQAALCSLEKPSLPLQIKPLEEISEAQSVEDPYAALRLRTPKGRSLEKAKKNYALIEPIVTTPHIAFSNRLRNQLMREQSKGDTSLRKQLTRQLLTYWQKGQTLTALAPEYGKATGERNYVKKPGRKCGAGLNPPPVNPEIRKLFDEICRKHLLQENGVSVRRAYTYCIEGYRSMHPDVPPEEVPSFNQFRYFYLSRFTPAERTARRVNSQRYDKDVRPLSGTSYDVVNGIGHTWSYDSTLADIHLVSSASREEKIARVRLDVITDDYSKMIVAVRATLQNAQYKTALETFSAAVCDKKEYVKRYGLEIEASDWPVKGLPQCLKGDNGELQTKQAVVLSRSLGVRFEATPSYRADSKSIVERMIGMIQAEYTDGESAVPAKETSRKAGGKETRHKATLNLSELNAIAIRAAIQLNHRALEIVPSEYPAHEDGRMLRPIDVWNWARDMGRSYLRGFSGDEQLRIALLPRYKASFSREGIKVEGLRYWNADAQRRGWFDRAKDAKRPTNMSVALDPSDISHAWLFPDDSENPYECWPCELHSADRRFKGMSLTEAREARKQIAANLERTRRAYDIEAGKARTETQALRAQARSETPQSGASTAAIIAQIPQNRQAERILEEKGKQLMPQMQDNSVEPNEPGDDEIDYSFPDDYVPPFMRDK